MRQKSWSGAKFPSPFTVAIRATWGFFLNPQTRSVISTGKVCPTHFHPSWLHSPWLLPHTGSHNLQQLSKLVVNCSFMASSSFCSRQTAIRCVSLPILDVCPISVLLRGLRKGIDLVWPVCLIRKVKVLVAQSCLTGTPWAIARQASLSMGFSRQEYWSGLPFPSPGDLPDPRIEPRSLALLADSSLTELPGNWKGPQTTWVPRLEGMDIPLFAPLGLGSTKSFNFCSKGVFISKFWPYPND